MTQIITAVKGDITKQSVDVIVNAANSRLLGGGGVDGAIHEAAGPNLLRTCLGLRASDAYRSGLAPGKAVMTPGFDLPAWWIVHTVGPIYDPNDVDDLRHVLRQAYFNSLSTATLWYRDAIGPSAVEIERIAFPAISAGVYGWPLEDAARVAVETVKEFLDDFGRFKPVKRLKEVRFVLFDDNTHQVFSDLL